MRYIECPAQYVPKRFEFSVFMAGGISGCPDWQSELSEYLTSADVTLLNPRRANFGSTSTKPQIAWEQNHLRLADAILFWFPKETLCPITLFELGSWVKFDKPLVIGVHPEYARRTDVEIQIDLLRPTQKIVYSLAAVAEQVRMIADRPRLHVTY